MIKWNIEVSLKDIYAGLALIIAIVLSFVGTFLPPQGEIHDSMLYLIAQFLLLVATLMGVGYFYNKWSKKTDMLGRHIGERMMGEYGYGQSERSENGDCGDEDAHGMRLERTAKEEEDADD